ncbi:uncharacterized protein LOC135201651 isoform X5 [Macrobrachium nipponense]|uniref:uncharacterized protein LOC135201651 isoform X5 n=1 Tax=Macrobrachium nipponense TaxID=159736 RepID=UPI0030C81F37
MTNCSSNNRETVSSLSLSLSLSLQIFREFGYVVVFSTSTVLYLIGLQYLLFMKETLPLEKRENDPPYYLFSRLMFDWDATQYSYWASYRDFVAGAAMIILIPVLVNRLKLRDVAIGITGGGSAVFMFVLLGQIRSSDMLWLMIIAPLIGLWKPGVYVALRAIWSKMATRPQELGKLFAAQTIIGVAGEAVSGPIFSAFYSITLYSFQGASFLLCAIFFTLVVFGIRFCEVFIQRSEMKTTHWIST